MFGYSALSTPNAAARLLLAVLMWSAVSSAFAGDASDEAPNTGQDITNR